MAIEFVPGGEFHDLRHLRHQYAQARSVASEVTETSGSPFDVEQLWSTHWFPLLLLLGKGFLPVDLAESKGSTSPVHIVWDDSDPEDGARVAWESVRSFVEAVVDRLEKGVYSVDDDGIV
jgi:hypothetical protein